MKTFEKQYEPIELKDFLSEINPYRGSLEYTIKNFNKKPLRSLLELTTLSLAPGGGLYILKRFDNVLHEVCLKEGEGFTVPLSNLSSSNACILEISKIGLAYLGSSIISYLI